MKFLVVDDDLINRKLLSALLQPYGRSDVAANGEEAVEAFEHALKNKDLYDIIFLDIMMPTMNGHEALKKIREIEEANGIHLGHGSDVVMVTALSDKRNVLSAFSEGCEYYLVKPIDHEKLRSLMDEIQKAHKE